MCVWVETLLLLRVMERGEEVQVGKGVGGQVGADSEACMDGCKIEGVSVIQYRSCARAVLASDWVDVIRGLVSGSYCSSRSSSVWDGAVVQWNPIVERLRQLKTFVNNQKDTSNADADTKGGWKRKEWRGTNDRHSPHS